MQQHDRIVAYVNDPAFRRDRLHDLMHVFGRGETGPDVKKLPDSGLGSQIPHHPGQKSPAGTR